MKKYLTTIMISLVIGFFLSYFLLKQYNGYNGIAVYNEGYEYYFLEYGKYESKQELETSAINLENYVYRKDGNLYYMYIGITKNKNNASKMQKYYKNKNYETEVKTFFISNKKFNEIIDNLDNILINSNDEVVINEIINQGINKYEEVILSGSKD